MSKHHESDWKQPVDLQKIEKSFQKEVQRRQMHKIKKQLKPNRQPKPARRKDWLAPNPDEAEEFDFEASERVMPRGERERRRNLIAITRAVVDEEEERVEGHTRVDPGMTRQGIVIEVSSGLCRVEVEGRSLLCKLRGSLGAAETGFTNVVAVGDEVMVFTDGSEWGTVEKVLPRRTVLARPDVFYHHRQQVIVANADQLLIVAAWRNPALWPELVDRYLITAERNQLRPLLCINKIDLAEDLAACQQTLQPYQALGYPVIFSSALTGQGVDRLREALRERITVLAGLSGVGKSSLLAAVQPDLQLRTGAVSEHSGEGQHTTTQVTMLSLAGGGFVMDTPGIREFGLSGLARRELIRFYSDLAAVAVYCRFADCTHLHEPDCAVKAAVAQGALSAMRHDSYQKIYGTLPA